METNLNNIFNTTTTNNEDDDALSLRHLHLSDQTATSSTRSSPRASSSPEQFEFIPTVSNPTATGAVVFFGKVISHSVNNSDNENTNFHNKNQTRDHYRSSSTRLPDRPTEHVIRMRSVSSVSSKTKRRLFTLGPVKFTPEMEMGSIRERQGRRTPSRMFPAADGGNGRRAVAGTEKNERVRCRARLNSVFERSLSCLRI